MTPLQKKVVDGVERDELVTLLGLFSKASENGPVPDPSAAVVLTPYSERTKRTGRIPLVYREAGGGNYSLQTLEGEPAAAGSVNVRFEDRLGFYAWYYTARKIQKKLNLPVLPLRQHAKPGVLRPLRGKGVGATLYMAGSIRALALWARDPSKGAPLRDTQDVATYSLPTMSRCPGSDETRNKAADRFWRSAEREGLTTTLPAKTLCVSDKVEMQGRVSYSEQEGRFPSRWEDELYADWRSGLPSPGDLFVDIKGDAWTVKKISETMFAEHGPWIVLIRPEAFNVSERAFARFMQTSPLAVERVEFEDGAVHMVEVAVRYGPFYSDVEVALDGAVGTHPVTGSYKAPSDANEDIDIMYGLQLLEEGDCLLFMGALYDEFEEDEPFRWANPLVYKDIDVSTTSAAALAYTLAAREKPYIQKALRALKDNEHLRSPEDEEKVDRVVKLLGIKPGRKENPDQRAEVRARAAWISGLTVGGDG